MECSRRGFLGFGGSAALLAATGCRSFGSVAADGGAPESLEATKRWFKEAQFGMMVHWGLYTLLGGEWRGRPGLHRYDVLDDVHESQSFVADSLFTALDARPQSQNPK